MSFFVEIRDCNFIGKSKKNGKGIKSERRMPRLPEAKKDVVSCEKSRGSANRN